MTGSRSYIRWFKEIGIDNVPLVGGKNASLGEMYQNLTADGVRVPNGFAITADAYRYVNTITLGNNFMRRSTASSPITSRIYKPGVKRLVLSFMDANYRKI